MKDRFYDYSSFSDERLEAVLKSWDGLGGYHGLLIKRIAEIIPPNSSVLDVGSGLLHLFEVIKDKVSYYCGVDSDAHIVSWAKERYPNIEIINSSVYDLDLKRKFDYVTAVGLYSDKPKERRGIEKLLDHASVEVILTYWKDEQGINLFDYDVHGYPHDIDSRLAIVGIYP